MQDKTAPPADAKYLMIVCGLLLIIVILLGFLWVRERQTSNDLRGQLDTYRTRFQQMALSGQLGKMLAAKAGAQAALARAELATEVVTFNGERRTVMLVGAAAGRRIGLEPGDVIVVSSPPAAPATEPATRTGGDSQ